MTWQVELLDEALNDLRKLDGSVKVQVLKGIRKVSQNPLPTNQGGYGKLGMGSSPIFEHEKSPRSISLRTLLYFIISYHRRTKQTGFILKLK